MELRAVTEIDGETYHLTIQEDAVRKAFGCYELFDTEGENEFIRLLFALAVDNRWGVEAPKLN